MFVRSACGRALVSQKRNNNRNSFCSFGRAGRSFCGVERQRGSVEKLNTALVSFTKYKKHSHLQSNGTSFPFPFWHILFNGFCLLFWSLSRHKEAPARHQQALFIFIFLFFILFNLTYTNVNDNINAPANFKRSFTYVKVVIYHNVKTRHYKFIMVIKISLN